MTVILKYLLKIMLVLLIIIISLVIGVIIFTKTAPQFGSVPDAVRLKKIEKSENFYDGQFQNLVETKMDLGFIKLLGVMKEWVFNSSDREPNKDLPVRFGQGRAEYASNQRNQTCLGSFQIFIGFA